MPVTTSPEARIARLQAQVESDGFNQAAHFALGQAYAEQGRHVEAAAKFRRAVELNPQYASAWKGLGDAYVLAGVPKEARAALATGQDMATRTGDPATAEACRLALAAVTGEDQA